MFFSCSLFVGVDSTPFLKKHNSSTSGLSQDKQGTLLPPSSFCTTEETEHENPPLSDFGSFQLLRGTKHIRCLPATLRILPHRSNPPNAANICENLAGKRGVGKKSGLNHCSHWRQAHSASSPVICSIWGCQNFRLHHSQAEAPYGGFAQLVMR